MARKKEEVSAFSTSIPPHNGDQENHRLKSSPKMSQLRLSPSIYHPNPTKTQPPTLRTATILILPLLSLTGFLTTWFVAYKNGLLFQLMSNLNPNSIPTFPGTNEALILNFTGIDPLDRYLVVLTAFFAPVVGGEFPDLSAFGKPGIGEFAVAWTLMVMEGLRFGNRGKVVSYITVFGLFIQTISLTITLPIYLLIHTLTSPISHPTPSAYASPALFIPRTDLVILPYTILLSYIIPSLLMIVPFQHAGAPSPTRTIVSTTTHQYLIALWQLFPLLTLSSHYFLRKGYEYYNWKYKQIPIQETKHDPSKSPSKTTTTKPSTTNATSYLHSVRPIYFSLLFLLILTHFPILLSTLLPASTSTLLHLPSTTATFSSVFIPSNPFSMSLPREIIKNREFNYPLYAHNAKTFLQYDVYIATLALLIWAFYLRHTAVNEKLSLDPNSLPSYSPSCVSPYGSGEGFFGRQTNSRYRELLSGGSLEKGEGRGWARGVRWVVKWGVGVWLGGRWQWR